MEKLGSTICARFLFWQQIGLRFTNNDGDFLGSAGSNPTLSAIAFFSMG